MTAQPLKDARGTKLVLKVGDGANSEVFTALCTINTSRGITISSPTNEFPQIDCNNPDAVAWLLREKSSVSAAVSGAGTVNTPDVGMLFDWAASPDSRNCKIILDVPSSDGGVIFTGKFHLTEFALTGDRGAKVTATMSLASDGTLTKTANT